MSYTVDVSREVFSRINSRIQTLQFARQGKYFPGDTLFLREKSTDGYTGRTLSLLIVDVQTSEFLKDGYCVLSFEIISSAPKISFSAFMGLYDLYVESKRECELLKEKI